MRARYLWSESRATRFLTIVLRRKRGRCFASQSVPHPAVDDGVQNFRLSSSIAVSPDSKILTFDLPSPRSTMGVPAPSGVKLVLGDVEKSYSPVSHESTRGTFDLLVKSYPGNGFGAYLNSLKVGHTAPMKIKPPRVIHGSTSCNRRWKQLGLVAGGTGVAPFVQIIRSILADESDFTRIRLLSINRREEDILMRAKIDALARTFPERLSVQYSLTAAEDISSSWTGHVGRGSTDIATDALPSASGGNDVLVMVCGTDGFVETWAGPIQRVPADPSTGTKKHKLQGPVKGILSELGFSDSQVYKF